MKLHLPKVLFTALMATFVACLSTSLGADIISINFYINQEQEAITDQKTGTLGGVNASGWNNSFSVSSSENVDLKKQDGTSSGASLTLSGTLNSWNSKTAPGETLTSVVQSGYIDVRNTGENHYTISVDHDYWVYDVVFYMSGDSSGSYASMNVNGVSYKGQGVEGTTDAVAGSGGWGVASTGITEYNHNNTLTVGGQMGKLVVTNDWVDRSTRATLAGLQIVEKGYYATLDATPINVADTSWLLGNAGEAVSYANLPADDKFLIVNADTAGSTLIFEDGDSMNHIGVKANALTVQSSGSITAGSLRVADGATLNLDTNITVQDFALEGTGVISMSGTLAVSSFQNTGGVDSIVIKDGGVLDLTATDNRTDYNDLVTINDNTAIKTEQGGFVKVAFNNTTSSEIMMDGNITLKHNIEAQGAVLFHGRGSGKAYAVEVGEGVTFKVMGDTPNDTSYEHVKGLSIIQHAVLNITGGSVEASEISLGHGDGSSDYKGTVNMTAGSLKTGTVYLRQNHPNVFNVTGGTLEFTQANAFNRLSPTNSYGEPTLNTATTITIQGTDDHFVTLKANTCDWTLDGAELATAPVIGNVTIDENNAHAITFKNVALTGTIANNKELALGGSISVAENNTATITGGKLTVLNTLSNTTGTLALNTSTIYVNADDLADFSHTEGTVAYSLSGDVNATNELSNGFKMTSGATYYIAEGSNISTSVKSVNLDESTSYELTSDTTGLGFVYGAAVRSDEYYISRGDVTVDSTVQALADSYIVTGGTMLVTEGSIAGININYTDGAINLSETAILTGLVAASDSAKLGAITGSGTVEVSVANNWADTIAIANTFTGMVYVNGGSRFTYDSNGLGSTLKLARDVHMQVNGGGSLTDTLTLESGNHEVHVNGVNTFNITGTINGEGTFDKRGGSSTVNINAGAVVSRYTNTVGTTNVNGGEVNYLINAGGTTNVSGGEVGNIMISAGTLNLTGNATITGEGATNNTNRYAGIYSSASGTINVGNGTDASTVTTTRLEMGDGGADTLNIMQKATFIVTGEDVTGAEGGPNAYWRTGFLLGEYGAASTMNVEGTLLVKNAHIGHGNNTGHINIKDGAVVAAKGLHGSKNLGSPSESGRINLTLEDGGKLILGEGGIDVSNLDSSLAAGTIGISADATIADGLTLTSANGTTFDTQKYNWDEAGTAITQGTEGGTLTISGAISGDGKLVKSGAGTLMLSGANNYTGGTTINAGTLKLGNASALGTGGVTVGSGATLDLNGISINGAVGNGKAVTLQGGATLTNTGHWLTQQVAGQMAELILEGDAVVVGNTGGNSGNFGLIATGWGATTLAMGGGNTLSKQGSSNFWLVNTTVTGTGSIDVQAGLVQVGSTNANASDKGATAEGVVFKTSGGTLGIVNNATLTAKGVEGDSGMITGTAGTTLALNSSDNHTYGGSVEGSLALTKSGTGTQTFSGTSSTFASVTVNEGELTLGGESATVNGAVTNAGTISVNGGTATMNSTVTSTGTVNVGNTATITANGDAATMSGVQMSGSGISGTTADSSMSNALVAIQEAASFSISDMALTNVSLSAADARVNLSNVSGDATIQAGTVGLQMITTGKAAANAVGSATDYSMSYTVNGNPSLTLGSTDAKVMISADPTIDSAGVFGTYTLTFNLGLTLDASITDYSWLQLVGFEGVLGDMLTAQNAAYVGVTENTPATVTEGGVPTVSYDYTAGTGSNVGSLVITISGLNVPEPSTATLSLLALAALAARRRRKK